MKAIIFAAGLGTRLKPWTDHHPKCLALVNNKPLLQRNIEYLQKFNITDVVVNVHHFADQIIEAIEKNKGWGSNVSISDETDFVLETGGGLLFAKPLLYNEQPFVSLNADILTNFNLNSLIEFYNSENPLVCFGVTDRKSSRSILFDESLRMCGWRNNQNGEEKIMINKPNLIAKSYSCVVVYSPKIFDCIKEEGKFSIMTSYLSLCAEHKILGYDHTGDILVDVGKPESIAEAEKYFT